MGIIFLPRRYSGDLTDDIKSAMKQGEIVLNADTGELHTKDVNDNVNLILTEDTFKEKFQQTEIISPDEFLQSYLDTSKFFIDPETGKISVVTDGAVPDDAPPLVLVDTWRDNLRAYEKYTYPIRYDGDDYYINDGGDDIYDRGNYITIDDIRLAYSNSIYRSVGFLIFKFDSVNNIKFSGNTGADGYGDVLAEHNIKIDENKEIYTSYKVVEHGRGEDPSIHHIVFSNKPVQVHDYDTNTDNDYDAYLFDRAQAVLVVMWTVTDDAWNGGTVTYTDLFHALFG